KNLRRLPLAFVLNRDPADVFKFGIFEMKYPVDRGRFARQFARDKGDLKSFLPRKKHCLIDVAGDHRDIAETQHAFEKAFGNAALAGDTGKSELCQPLR